MAPSRSFGRRTAGQPQPRFAKPAAAQSAPSRQALSRTAPAEAPVPAAARTNTAPLDEELKEWKRQRRSFVRIPWRQLSLTASLCFGIASFELPDSVNGWVNWLLYGLMAASFCTWFINRRRKSKA